MRRTFVALVLAAVVIGLAAGSSRAESPRRVGIAVFGGYGTYSMSDVNDAIASPGALFPGATTSAGEISGGAEFGGGLRFRRSDRVTVALDVSRLLAKTTGAAVFLGTPYEGELSVPATSLALTVQYLFHSASSTRFGVGLGGGYYSCSGKLSANGGGPDMSGDLSGSGFGFHALGVGDLTLSKAVHVEVGAGYRYAKTTDIDFEGTVLSNSDGSKSTIDWSGFMGRIGTTFYLGAAAEAPSGK